MTTALSLRGSPQPSFHATAAAVVVEGGGGRFLADEVAPLGRREGGARGGCLLGDSGICKETHGK